MTGFSLSVGVKLWPPSLVVEFTPTEVEEVDDDGPVGHVSDTRISVDDFEGTWVNKRMGFAP